MAIENPIVGIDFGTTNSSIALLKQGKVLEAQFHAGTGTSRSSRSLLYLERERSPGGVGAVRAVRAVQSVRSWTGSKAIEHYLAADEDAQKRLIQSLKSHLAARSLTGTEIFGKQYRFEELVTRILRDLRRDAGEAFGFEIRRAVVGRPVTFVGAVTESDNEFAEQRLKTAFADAGFEEVSFALEPVAAAHAYYSQGAKDGLVLIGDFGGGTTDFSLLQIHEGQFSVLGNSGVSLAGDAFDARIVRRLISPSLGADSSIVSLGKELPALPAWVYRRLEHWHTLSFLRTREVRDMIRSSIKRASEPDKLEALLTIVEEDLGYRLHQAVQRTKVQLSEATAGTFTLDAGAFHLRQDVTRDEFETWIAPELEQMSCGIEDLLARTGVQASAVDQVFLTGGTSLVPAVRRIFTDKFRRAAMVSGDVFTSVTQGLARIAGKGAEN